jgi:hypothetical protein
MFGRGCAFMWFGAVAAALLSPPALDHLHAESATVVVHVCCVLWCGVQQPCSAQLHSITSMLSQRQLWSVQGLRRYCQRLCGSVPSCTYICQAKTRTWDGLIPFIPTVVCYIVHPDSFVNEQTPMSKTRRKRDAYPRLHVATRLQTNSRALF